MNDTVSPLKSTFIKYAPVFFIVLYLLATFLVFCIGPINWESTSKEMILVSLLVLVSTAMIFLGYFCYIQKNKANFRQLSLIQKFNPSPNRIIVWVIVVSSIVNILSIWLKLILMYSPYIDLWSCIRIPGLGYILGQNLQKLSEMGQMPKDIAKYSFIFKGITLASGICILNYTLGWFSWKHLKLPVKLLYAGSILSTLLYYWISGTQMGFGMIVFMVLPIIIFHALRASNPVQNHKVGISSWFSKYKNVIFEIVVLLAAFIMIFGIMQVSRSQVKKALKDSSVVKPSMADITNIVNADPGINGEGDSSANDLDISKMLNSQTQYALRYSLDALPKPVSFGAFMLSFYIGNGYKGLSSAMTIPFQWTYGLGWSNGLLQLAEKYLHVSGVWERTYLYRNEQIHNWPAMTYWSTIYPWLASDVTYFGVPIVMFFLGYFFALVWKDLIVNRNFMAIVILGQLFQLFIMFPANDQLFNTVSGVFSNFLIILLYIVSRTKMFKRLESTNDITQLS